MSWDEVRIWGLYVVFALQLVVQAAGWVARRSLATPEQLFALREEIRTMKADLEERIRIERSRIHEANTRHSLLEQRVGSLPDYDDLKALSDSVGHLTAATAALAENVKSLDRSNEKIDAAVTRIEDTLLNMKRVIQ
jgi:hypothetical protein